MDKMKVRGVIGILLVGLAGWLSACGGKSEPEEEQTVQTSLMQETSQVTVIRLSSLVRATLRRVCKEAFRFHLFSLILTVKILFTP